MSESGYSRPSRFEVKNGGALLHPAMYFRSEVIGRVEDHKNFKNVFSKNFISVVMKAWKVMSVAMEILIIVQLATENRPFSVESGG